MLACLLALNAPQQRQKRHGRTILTLSMVDATHDQNSRKSMHDAGFVVVSALPNDSRYVSPASTTAPSPMGSRGGSFTTQGQGQRGTPMKSGLSNQSAQSAQSTGRASDFGDTAASGENS